MAWRCSGTSNGSLIENLWKSDIIKDKLIRDAMIQTDRGLYMPRQFKREVSSTFIIKRTKFHEEPIPQKNV